MRWRLYDAIKVTKFKFSIKDINVDIGILDDLWATTAVDVTTPDVTTEMVTYSMDIVTDESTPIMPDDFLNSTTDSYDEVLITHVISALQCRLLES